VNAVGLRRRGFSREVRQEIKRAYHLLFGSKLRLEEALEKARKEGFASAEVERLLAFVEASARGVSR
jgi:UDP-N-acetylglucosamine acyltransferase